MTASKLHPSVEEGWQSNALGKKYVLTKGHGNRRFSISLPEFSFMRMSQPERDRWLRDTRIRVDRGY